MRPIVLPLAVIGAFLLACGGGASDDTSADDGVTDVADNDDDDDAEEEQSAEERLQGSWALRPGDDALRYYKIMRAACSGRKKALDKVGKLTDAEKRTYDYYADKPQETKDALLKLIKGMASTRYTFADGTVTWSIDGEDILDKKYTIESEDPLEVKLEYGSSHQTWFIDWTDADNARVDLQYEGSDVKIEHKLKRMD